jgi:hypothetical protein
MRSKPQLAKTAHVALVGLVVIVAVAGGCRSGQGNSSTAVYQSDEFIASGGAGTSSDVTEGMGSAESASGQSMNQSSGGMITDATIFTSGDWSDVSGRPVQFWNLTVRSVMGNQVASVDAGNGQSLYLYCASGTGTLEPGDLVNVEGFVRTSASDLSGNALRVLSSQSAYIDAQKIERAQ